MTRKAKKRLKKPALSPDEICKKAIALIAVEGLENLSMRRLAEALDVKAASLYNHVKSRRALLNLVQERVFSFLDGPGESGSWQTHLRQLAVALRKLLLQYPKVVPLFALHPTVTISGLKQAERSFGVLKKAGFSPHEIVFIYQTLSCFVLGHTLAEVGTVPAHEDEGEGARVNPIDFPNICAAYTYEDSSDLELWFQFGLDSMILGWEKYLKP